MRKTWFSRHLERYINAQWHSHAMVGAELVFARHTKKQPTFMLYAVKDKTMTIPVT